MEETNVEILKMLDKESVEEVFKKIIEKQNRLENENIQLKQKAEKSEKVLRAITSEGINDKDIAPIEIAAPLLDLKPEEMIVLREKNPGEYIKQVYRKFNTLMATRMRELEDRGMTLNGDKMGDMFKEVDEYLALVPEVDKYTPELTAKYPEKVKLTRASIRLLFDWQPIIAEVLTYHTAHSDMIMHYSSDEIIKQNKSKIEKVEQQIVTNFEEEKRKMDESKELKTAEETKHDPIIVLTQKTEKQSNLIEQLIKTLQDKFVEKEEQPSAVVIDETEMEVKKRKK